MGGALRRHLYPSKLSGSSAPELPSRQALHRRALPQVSLFSGELPTLRQRFLGAISRRGKRKQRLDEAKKSNVQPRQEYPAKEAMSCQGREEEMPSVSYEQSSTFNLKTRINL